MNEAWFEPWSTFIEECEDGHARVLFVASATTRAGYDFTGESHHLGLDGGTCPACATIEATAKRTRSPDGSEAQSEVLRLRLLLSDCKDWWGWDLAGRTVLAKVLAEFGIEMDPMAGYDETSK